MRKIFQAIGKATIRLMATVVGIAIGASVVFLPVWLGTIIVLCAFVVLVICLMEE